jgi:hypothetical protein
MKMSNTGNALEDDPKRPKSKRPKLGWYWKLAGFLFFSFTIFYMLMPVLNSFGIESIRCEVVSAKPDTSSGGSRGSASTAGVLVDTSNCGKIHVSKGVTFDSQEEVAASFKAGTEYEFDLGWFSRVVTKDIRHEIPSALDYRLVK